MSAATLRALGLLLALTGGCTSNTASDIPVPAPVQASGPRLELGQVHRYALDWQGEATRSREGGGVSGGLALQGELAVAAIGHGPEGTRVSVWFPRLTTRELRVQGQRISLDASLLVGPRAELIVAADGDVRRAFFAADSAPIFRELMTGVIARLDLRGASTGTGPRTARGPVPVR